MRLRPSRSPTLWWWIAATAFVLAVAAALAYLSSVSADGLDRADKIASVTSLMIGIAALLVSAVALRLGLRQGPSAAADKDETALSVRVTDDLAATILQQWRREAGLRHLQRPHPLRLQWSTTQRPVAASAKAVLGPGVVPGTPIRLRLRGDVPDVSRLFYRLPARQLVVLGAPGAGKTTLLVLLTLDLLDDRRPGEPVPVPLSISSWDPGSEPLEDWLTRRLVTEYPALANSAAYGFDAAARLVAEGGIIPILDGLDELPVSLQSAALTKLDEACAGERPLLLTARSADYEEAVTAGGEFLRRAAVVEIEPVRVEDAISFIAASQVAGDDRWHPVYAHLRHQPHGALARALSTPLMAQLARITYARPSTSPVELCDLTRFPTEEAVEGHLLDSYLPAVYSDPAGRPDKAGTWLAFLARHLRHLGTHDLAWWHLDRRVPRLLFGLIPGLIAGSALILLVTPLVGAVTAIPYGLAGCLTASVVWWLARRYQMPRLRTPMQRRLGHLAIGLVLGLATATLANRDGELTAGLIVGLLGGCAEGLVAASVGGYGLLRMTPLEEINPQSPRSVLVAARAGSLRRTLAAGFIVGVGAGVAMAFLVEPGGQVAPLAAGMGAVGGIMIGFDTPTGRFLLARAFLASRGRLPWNLMPFLEDAHRRGVLRQSGAVYQFRHARLRDRLAATQRPMPGINRRPKRT